MRGSQWLWGAELERNVRMRFERLILATGVLTAAGMGTPAFAAMDVADAMGLCSRITKADARVECYDQVARDAAAGRFQASAAPAPAPQQNWAAPPQAVAPAPRTPQDWTAPPVAVATPQAPQSGTGFGSESIRRTAEERRDVEGPDSMQAQVASATDNGLAQWRVKLANGAIWQMTERVSLFRPPAPGETVTIKRAALGSFLMDVGSQGSVRVRRVQ